MEAHTHRLMQDFAALGHEINVWERRQCLIAAGKALLSGLVTSVRRTRDASGIRWSRVTRCRLGGLPLVVVASPLGRPPLHGESQKCLCSPGRGDKIPSNPSVNISCHGCGRAVFFGWFRADPIRATVFHFCFGEGVPSSVAIAQVCC